VRTIIKMITGDKYVVEGMNVIELIGRLSTEDFIIIPGTEGRDDFAINTLAVSAVFTAQPREN
jgi:hypothetical protein